MNMFERLFEMLKRSNPLKRSEDQWQNLISPPGLIPVRIKGSYMKPNHYPRRSGFTLIELLVVIAIIGILAGMLMPALSRVKIKAQVAEARNAIKQIETAIVQYNSEYSRYPMWTNNISQGYDYTYGTTGAVDSKGKPIFISAAEDIRSDEQPMNNSQLVAILMNFERFPVTEVPTHNFGASKNPRRTTFLTAKKVGGISKGGVGDDLVFRDPWGKPYIVTIDQNYDGKIWDAFYGDRLEGQGIKEMGLVYAHRKVGAVTDRVAELPNPVGIWSFGPDGQIKAGHVNEGFNKDNVLSWK
jgi:prepilin-type N-terminal cleavage/methylation domain-containing protein